MGRAIGKLLANRLGALLVYDTSMLDASQSAFLPGHDIHDPISIVTQCYKHSQGTMDGQDGRALYAIFYDISKAYDNVKWSSIVTVYV